MQKMLNPKTTIWVIPESGIVNPKAPTATEINAGKNVSCAVVRGYTLNPTDSDTDDSASICDSGNVENRLYDNYEGEFTFFRDADVDDVDSVYNEARDLFEEPDQRVWIVRRLGKANTEPAAVGDKVELYLFSNDHMRSVDGGDNGPIQFTVPLLQQGNYSGYVEVVAGTP